ncbi:sugar-specific transcriptional regulator TrmB [Ruminiclostridium sufflavum DSM 19573]|uniref:Sugar-specific transcriptional regulator TrmB n=1 Tax=Ruminiclostridium sufflavum DSM 19573 TaxID=1121337 RepID=A0A318XJD3_9FIRM|nr:TrmB family transcriptional regulator [Ruminiclostridium sufflavum]PYG87310.1 sugar-specific transcriptional regulator TrmB [Ruminiclostridium sufflavum DSM 19573]
MDVIDALMNTGFTKHESILYVALCREGELTGYEASKLTGISRSNAYLGLAGLSDKGGAYKINGETLRYAPVDSYELAENLKRKFYQIFRIIEEEVPQVNKSKDTFITISGEEQILNKMKNLINQAQYRIYISIHGKQLDFVLGELKAAKIRGLKVVVIASEGIGLEDMICYKAQISFGSFRLITDSSNVLTGQLNGANSTGLFSMNQNLVDVIKDSLTNEIKLIQIENK